MNERIKELAEEAEEHVKSVVGKTRGWSDASIIEIRRNKFAELIIQECATMFTLTHADEQYPRRIDKTILKHFGMIE